MEFDTVASCVLALAGAAHAVRAYMEYPLRVGSLEISVRVSYVVAIGLLSLACWGMSG